MVMLTDAFSYVRVVTLLTGAHEVASDAVMLAQMAQRMAMRPFDQRGNFCQICLIVSFIILNDF